MDITTISSAYTSLKTIKEIGSSLLDAKIDAEAKARVAEVIEKLGRVQEALFFIREELIRVQDENQVLKRQIADLEKKLEQRGNVTYEKPSYWIIEGEKRDGPFCQRCYDVDNNLVRLQGGKNDMWRCYECRHTVYGPNYKPPAPRPRRGNSYF